MRPVYTNQEDHMTNYGASIITKALSLLTAEIRTADALATPQAVKDFLRLKLATKPHEVFAVLYLDCQNRLIEYTEMFRGTLTQTSVYPREVVKEALNQNAASVILCHNHPSGASTPSRADELLTRTLKDALALVDVRVLDHLIVTTGDAFSMAERGLM
jgi:DNA repair protein RadC